MITNWKDQTVKRRCWVIEIYLDSVNVNYLTILKELQCKVVISPIHNKDVWTIEDENNNKEHIAGTFKKPHRHIMLEFNGSRGLNYIEDIIEQINAYKHCQIVADKQLMYEYLWHKNNPEKVLYNLSDIIYINSTKYDWLMSEYIDILNYIDENKIHSLYSLTKQLRKLDERRLLQYVSNNTIYVKTYIDSYNNMTENKIKEAYNYLKSTIDSLQLESTINSDVVKRLLDVFNDVKILIE